MKRTKIIFSLILLITLLLIPKIILSARKTNIKQQCVVCVCKNKGEQQSIHGEFCNYEDPYLGIQQHHEHEMSKLQAEEYCKKVCEQDKKSHAKTHLWEKPTS